MRSKSDYLYRVIRKDRRCLGFDSMRTHMYLGVEKEDLLVHATLQ